MIIICTNQLRAAYCIRQHQQTQAAAAQDRQTRGVEGAEGARGGVLCPRRTHGGRPEQFSRRRTSSARRAHAQLRKMFDNLATKWRGVLPGQAVCRGHEAATRPAACRASTATDRIYYNRQTLCGKCASCAQCFVAYDNFGAVVKVALVLGGSVYMICFSFSLWVEHSTSRGDVLKRTASAKVFICVVHTRQRHLATAATAQRDSESPNTIYPRDHLHPSCQIRLLNEQNATKPKKIKRSRYNT